MERKLERVRNEGLLGLGGAFFPEHHPRRTWPDYVRKISAAGLSFVRMGEFFWDKIEPREGEYDFGWFDEVLALLAAKRIRVILCTPTAVPPLWACEKYPELFPVREDGKPFGFGLRRYTCPTSIAYHRLSEGIVSALAQRYGDSPQILAWTCWHVSTIHSTETFQPPRVTRMGEGRPTTWVPCSRKRAMMPFTEHWYRRVA